MSAWGWPAADRAPAAAREPESATKHGKNGESDDHGSRYHDDSPVAATYHDLGTTLARSIRAVKSVLLDFLQ
jgi:hypothetical protein